MPPLESFPSINAGLNGTCALLLLVGYFLIRNKQPALHQACMLLAFVVSVLFLSSYLYYHAHHGATRFQGVGWIRPVYFGILITHTVLAPVVTVLSILTLVLGLTQRLEKHKRVARWTLPAWLYVSATGVVIYWMLYRLPSH